MPKDFKIESLITLDQSNLLLTINSWTDLKLSGKNVHIKITAETSEGLKMKNKIIVDYIGEPEVKEELDAAD